MTDDGVILGLAIAAAAVAAIPLVAYLFVSEESALNPYRSSAARWIVWIGGMISLLLFLALTRD
jgi:hypothetical protein